MIFTFLNVALISKQIL